MSDRIAELVKEKLSIAGLKKNQFTFNVLATRRYPNTTFTWVEGVVNGKTYDIGDPYCGTRTTAIKNSLILSVLHSMEKN